MNKFYLAAIVSLCVIVGLCLSLLPGTSLLPRALAQTDTENVVKNSSFEVGTDGYEILRGETLNAGQKDVPWSPLVLDSSTAFNGTTSLRIDNPNKGTWRFFSREFKVDPSKQYVLSFAAKAGLAGQDLAVNIDTASGPYAETGDTFHLTTDWKRYTLGPVKIPGGQPYCTIQMMYGIYSPVTVGTSVWLDALQVQEAPTTNYTPHPLEVGIVNGLKQPYTLAKQQDYPVRLLVRNNTAQPASVDIRYTVTDEYFNKVVVKNSLKSFPVKQASTVTQALANVSPKRRGKYILHVDLMDAASGKLLDQSEFDFAVIDSVKRSQFTNNYTISDITQQQGGRPMGPMGDSTDIWMLFGGSADAFFDMRAEAGDRWIRSFDFYWSNIEPENGRYNWSLLDIFIQKAKARGIQVMPVLGGEFIKDGNRDLPAWLTALPGSQVADRTVGGGKVDLPSLDQWKSYIRACVTRYHGTVTTWEVLNEPNLWLTVDQYLLYLKSAYEIIKQIDPKAVVVGYSSSQDQGGAAIEYLDQCFKKGGLNYCDVVSFHPYSARLDWSKPLSQEGLNLKLRALLNQYGGQDKGLWVGELFFVGQEVAGADDGYEARILKGHELARRYLTDLSTGIGRSFTIPDTYYCKLFLPRSWAVNLHLTGGMIPNTTFVIYNTLTRLFEGAKPSDQVSLEGTNKLYSYTSTVGPIAAAWSFDTDNKSSVLTLPNAAGKIKALDIMGNSSDQVKQVGKDLRVTLSNSPVYLLPSQGANTAFSPLLKEAYTGTPAARAVPPAAQTSKSLWNLTQLSQPPNTYPAPGFESEGVQAIYYDGLPWKGKPTRVFAYVGMPAHTGTGKVPGIVLVHGGGGTAFPEWVRLWNSRGYAAIAMDTYGSVPSRDSAHPAPVRHDQGGPSDAFGAIADPPEDQWPYHAVADVILANSLLSSMPGVDAKRIGITGISWGGYLTCLVSGVDGRFKFAVPIYGCGFLAQDSVWLPDFQRMGEANADKWTRLWDPSQYLGRAKMPMLWMDGTNDPAYPLDSLQKSYHLLPSSQYTLSTRLNMGHAHGPVSENPEEIHVFADSVLTGTPPLARIVSQTRKGQMVQVNYRSAGPIARAELNITKDAGPWMQRRWETLPAQLDETTHQVHASLPDGTRVYYVNLTNQNGLIVSSEHRELPAAP